MSAVPVPAGVRAPAADRRPGLGRLTLVELRKMVDTRAGFWLLLAVVLLTVAAVVLLVIFGDDTDQALRPTLELAIQPSSILLPVVGVLLVSSEWSQRTALTTFTLVPQRQRVVAAKLAAGALLAVAAFAVSLVVAVAGTAVASPAVDDPWTLSATVAGQMLLSLVTSMLMGIGFGAVLLMSAPAIVLLFVLPIGWAALGNLSFLESAARWLDGSRSLAPLTDHAMSGLEWARAGTTLAVWVLLPVLAGAWRVGRADVK